MYVRWYRQQLRSNRQTEEILCPHDHIKQPWVTSPAVVHREGQKTRTLWRPGPAIRECCISRGKGLAIAAWWWEVEQRFRDLRIVGVPNHEDADVLLWQLDVIEEELEKTVPKPSKGDLQRYVWYREDLGLVRKQEIPGLRELGLVWPCTREDVDKRMRELARTSHPDRGGKAEDFAVYSVAYQAAKDAFDRLHV